MHRRYPGCRASGGGTTGSGLLKSLGGLISLKDLIGGAAGAAVTDAKNYINPTEALNKAQTYYKDEWGTLPQSTRTQLESYVNTPIADLAKQIITKDDQGLRLLKDQYDLQKSSILRQYAEAGQDPMNSSDAASRIAELDMNYNTAIMENQQKLENAALQEAVNIKKDVFAQSVQQQQVDYTVLMDIAGAYGYEQQVKTALAEKNTEELRALIAKMFSDTNVQKPGGLNSTLTQIFS